MTGSPPCTDRCDPDHTHQDAARNAARGEHQPQRTGGRILLGLAAVIAGSVLIASAGAAWVVVLEVLLIAAGVDLLVTGAIGHCPLYQKLGHVPRSLRSTHEHPA